MGRGGGSDESQASSLVLVRVTEETQKCHSKLAPHWPTRCWKWGQRALECIDVKQENRGPSLPKYSQAVSKQVSEQRGALEMEQRIKAVI